MSTINGIEIVTFEDVVLGWDEPLKCENNHKLDDNRECSGEAKYRVTDCKVSHLCCTKAAIATMRRKENGRTCKHCQRTCAECWVVTGL